MGSVLPKLDDHFLPYTPFFESATRSVAESAKHYLRGLYQSSRANMERMADVVSGSHYQRLHHMLSESSWDRTGVLRQLFTDANAHFGRGGTALVVDESGFAKKGEHSVGVSRQWNGRLGKTDNSQVGVFAAVTRNGVAALVDAELYLPESWISDTTRCEAAHVPETARKFRTKGEIALEMIIRARRNGLQFDWVAFDGGYGQLPWLLQALDGEGERFLAEVHVDQAVYLSDPLRGAGEAVPQTVTAWAQDLSAKAWRRMKLRDGEKGEVVSSSTSFLPKSSPMRTSLWLSPTGMSDDGRPQRHTMKNRGLPCWHHSAG